MISPFLTWCLNHYTKLVLHKALSKQAAQISRRSDLWQLVVSEKEKRVLKRGREQKRKKFILCDLCSAIMTTIFQTWYTFLKWFRSGFSFVCIIQRQKYYFALLYAFLIDVTCFPQNLSNCLNLYQVVLRISNWILESLLRENVSQALMLFKYTLMQLKNIILFKEHLAFHAVSYIHICDEVGYSSLIQYQENYIYFVHVSFVSLQFSPLSQVQGNS